MRIECFQARRVQDDGSRFWHWHAISGSRVTADSGEGYTRKRDCIRAAKRHLANCRKADPELDIIILDLYPKP